MTRIPLSLGAALLSGCMFGYTPAGPTYLGEVRRDARLELIARSPSEAGAREAMKRWIAEPMSLRAREAVLACAAAYPEPVESRFGEVAAEGRAKFFEDARTTLTGDGASALIVRVAQRSGMVDEGIAALRGRQDAVAVQSLLDVARGTGTIETRLAAVDALDPPVTALARDGLLALARDAAQPITLRAGAVEVLAPFDTPTVRAPLLALANASDDAVAAAVFRSMGTAEGESEVALLLAGSARDASAEAAVEALARTFWGTPLAPNVESRLLAMVDVRSVPPDGASWPRGQENARFAAARTLSRRDDARAYPALVRYLDSSRLGIASSDVLSDANVAMVPTLEQDAGALSTPAGKRMAARLLSTFGGPKHASIIRQFAPPREVDSLVAQLSTAPWGLFPSGTITYAPAVSDRSLLTQTLAEVTRAGETLGGDPVTRYIGAARAYLAGSRSHYGTSGLRTAADEATAAFGLATLTRVNVTGDGALAGRVVSELTGRVLELSGTKAIARTEPAGAALTVTGDLRCSVEDTNGRRRLPDSTYTYKVEARNARKDELALQVQSFPASQRTALECWLECTDNPGTTAQRTFRMQCDPTQPSYIGGLDRTCQRTVKQVMSDEYASLVDRYEREPETITFEASVPMTQIEVTSTHTEQCEGPLILAVGAATQSSRVNLAGRSSVSFVERSAQPVGAKGERLPPWSDTQGGATYDDLKPAFEAAIVAALGSFRPGEAEVRRMYADHVRVALQAGDLRAARQSLIWSQPALVGTDVASLQAFRRVFLADGAQSFPRAWGE